MGSEGRREKRIIEVRSVDNDEGKMIVEGYAIVFDQPATHQYGSRTFTEVVRRTALDKADMKDVPMRYNHQKGVMIMARTRNKSLLLLPDDYGLKVRGELIETQSNRDIYKGIEAKLIDKMSFAFTVADGGDTWTFGEEETHREIHNIERIFDVSAVDMPFYDATDIYARSFELLESEEKRLESLRCEVEMLKLKIKLKGAK